MRRLSMMMLAAAAVAVAAPAMAQRYDYDRGYDRGYVDRDRDYDSGFRAELNDLNGRVQDDLQDGVIGHSTAKAFFDRIQTLERADARARDKNGGPLARYQARDMRAAVDQVQAELSQHEARDRGYRDRDRDRY